MTIRYFEDVPHIVSYGMQDDQKQVCWILFWRHGVGFRVHVAHDEVRDTLFSKTWLEYVKEPTSLGGYKGWVQRWDSLCDCILSQCLPLLKKLAPNSGQWVTLDDYLHTPTYEVKMVKDPATKDATPEITEGPKDKPAYDHWPTAAANIKYLPTDLAHYHAKDLVVLDKEKNWRTPPHKVQTPDGQVFSFKACNKTAKNVTRDILENHSIDSINVHSLLFTRVATNVRIPLLKGIVVTEPSEDIIDSSPGAAWSSDPRAEHANQQHQDKELVAGILLTHMPQSRQWGELLRDEGHKPTAEQKAKWKQQITEVVEYLHGIRATLGGREGKAGDGGDAWYYLYPWLVSIAWDGEGTDGEAWLTPDVGCTFHGADDGDKFEQERAMDLKGLEKTFEDSWENF